MTSTYDSRVAALPEELRERLRQRLAGRADGTGGATVAGGIPRAQRGAPLPLSFAQQRLWFADQLQPGSTEYHSGAAAAAARRRWTCRAAARRCDAPGGPARDPAHQLRRAGRRRGPGDPPGHRGAAAGARPDRPPRTSWTRCSPPSTSARSTCPPGRRCGALLVRLGRRRARAAGHRAPHRGRTAGRWGCWSTELAQLYARGVRGRTGGPAAAADPVRRLRRLAARAARRGRARPATWTTGAASWPACRRWTLPTDRPRPAVAGTAGAVHEFTVPRSRGGPPGGAGPGAGDHPVHRAGRRLPGAARPVQRPGRHRAGHRGGRAGPAGAGAAGRLLRQHRGAALRQSTVRRRSGSCWPPRRRLCWRRCAPGRPRSTASSRRSPRSATRAATRCSTRWCCCTRRRPAPTASPGSTAGRPA